MKGSDVVQRLRGELDFASAYDVFYLALEYAGVEEPDRTVQAKLDMRRYRQTGQWTGEVVDLAIDYYTGRFDLELAQMYGPGDENAPPENGDATEETSD